MGAAIQGGVLGGDDLGIVLLDVTPLRLGIETLGGVMTKLIERNTTIPTQEEPGVLARPPTTRTRSRSTCCRASGRWRWTTRRSGDSSSTGLPPAPRGIPQVEVTFDIDANGILAVSAEDKATGKEQSIRIQASSGLSDQEVQRMVRDAEANAGEDHRRRELIDARNEADSRLHSVRKSLEGLRADADPAQVTDVETKLKALEEVAKGDDAAIIRTTIEALLGSMQVIAQQAYEKASAARGADQGSEAGRGPAAADAGPPPPPPDAGQSGDAEYEVVDE